MAELARITFHLPDLSRIYLYFTHNGEHEDIRKIMRQACENRRSMVSRNPYLYAASVVAGMRRYLPQLMAKPREDAARWNYALRLEGKIPLIKLPGEFAQPLFSFLGSRHRDLRKFKEIAALESANPLRHRRRGRPSKLDRFKTAPPAWFDASGLAKIKE
jgi:hypothetical protein